MEQLSDIQILETIVGGIKIKDMSALTFVGWLANKLNGVAITNEPNLNELRMAVATPPLMGKMAEESKIKYVRKLLAIGIQI